MHFNPAETVALSREIDASASLLSHGFAMLAEYRFPSRDIEPVFACLAGGTEKLLKLTFGLLSIDGGGQWPSQATMKDAGHKIVELDATVRRLIVEPTGRSTAPGLIARLLEHATYGLGESLDHTRGHAGRPYGRETGTERVILKAVGHGACVRGPSPGGPRSFRAGPASKAPR